jgi:hypothetical protein
MIMLLCELFKLSHRPTSDVSGHLRLLGGTDTTFIKFLVQENGVRDKLLTCALGMLRDTPELSGLVESFVTVVGVLWLCLSMLFCCSTVGLLNLRFCNCAPAVNLLSLHVNTDCAEIDRYSAANSYNQQWVDQCLDEIGLATFRPMGLGIFWSEMGSAPHGTCCVPARIRN